MVLAADPEAVQSVGQWWANNGVATGLVAFGCVLLWRLAPHLTRWLVDSAASNRALADAMPEVKNCLVVIKDGQMILPRIAASTEKLNETLERLVASHLNSIKDGVDELLRRVPPAAPAAPTGPLIVKP